MIPPAVQFVADIAAELLDLEFDPMPAADWWPNPHEDIIKFKRRRNMEAKARGVTPLMRVNAKRAAYRMSRQSWATGERGEARQART